MAEGGEGNGNGAGPVVGVPELPAGNFLVDNNLRRDSYYIYNEMTMINFVGHNQWVEGCRFECEITSNAIEIMGGLTINIWSFEHIYPHERRSTITLVYVSLYTLGMLRRAANFDPSITYIKEDISRYFIPPRPLLLPEVSDLENLYTAYNTFNENRTRKYSIGVGEDMRIQMVILPFMVLPGFQETYQEYRLHPDKGADFDNFPRRELQEGQDPATLSDMIFQDYQQFYSKFPLRGNVRTDITQTGMFSADEWKCIVFCILICSGKQATPENLTTALKNRVSAIRNAEGMRIDPAIFTQDVIDVSSFSKICELMVDYPILKNVLIRHVLTSSDTYSQHVKSILKGANLSMFTCIINFLGTETPTYLHLVPQVLRDTISFNARKKALIHKYGREGWQYHKLFFPNDQEGATTEFTHLVNAAKAWAVTAGKQAGMVNIQVKQQLSEERYAFYKEKAGKALPQHWVTGGLTEEGFRELVRDCDMKINLDVLTPAEWNDLINGN